MFSINLKFSRVWLFARNNTFWIKPFSIWCDFFAISSSTSFLAWNLTIFRMCLPDDLQLKYQHREVLKGAHKKPAKFAQKLYTQKPLFGWRQSFLLVGGQWKKFYTKTLKKSFSHILWLLWFYTQLWNKNSYKKKKFNTNVQEWMATRIESAES